MKSLLNIDALALQLGTTENTSFDNKYVANKYKLIGNAYQVSDDIQLRKSDKIEKFYLYSFAVWINDKHIATLSTNCRQPGQSDSLKLAFKNEVFYSRPGFNYYLSILKQQMPLQVLSISYLELAYDFQALKPLLPRLSNIVRHCTFDKLNPAPRYAPLRGQLTCTPHNFTLYAFGEGAKVNGKQVVAYNKTDEIKTSAKDYILAYYAENGFDMSLPVERIEVRLGSKYLGKYPEIWAGGLTLEKLGNLFRVGVGDTFVFRKLGEVSYDANRNKKTATVTLIEFPEFSNEPLYVCSQDRENSVSDYRNRIEVKNTVWRYIQCGNSQDLDQLKHIKKAVKAPKDADWSYLFRRYAQQFEGSPNAESMTRLEEFL